MVQAVDSRDRWQGDTVPNIDEFGKRLLRQRLLGPRTVLCHRWLLLVSAQ